MFNGGRAGQLLRTLRSAQICPKGWAGHLRASRKVKSQNFLRASHEAKSQNFLRASRRVKWQKFLRASLVVKSENLSAIRAK